ncbi:MAG TPA: hypothetical protein VF775_07200 [Geobacteraceae bacterium]
MVVGFNHNVMYKGEVFHIQTEDSGINNPHIITLLYRGGTILASKKTSYADIIKMENLDQVVEDLMKEQHKDMLRNLKAGKFDERAFGSRPATPQTQKPAEEGTPHTEPPSGPVSPSRHPSREAAKPGQSLDEVILDYLVRGEDR